MFLYKIHACDTSNKTDFMLWIDLCFIVVITCYGKVQLWSWESKMVALCQGVTGYDSRIWLSYMLFIELGFPDIQAGKRRQRIERQISGEAGNLASYWFVQHVSWVPVCHPFWFEIDYLHEEIFEEDFKHMWFSQGCPCIDIQHALIHVRGLLHKVSDWFV